MTTYGLAIGTSAEKADVPLFDAVAVARIRRLGSGRPIAGP